ncbi:MAG TPA: glutathione S-transferase family protein [Terriglobales bacterium]|nr:glutathione S-transferase family protein [Terriglobales bacterium]
MPTLYGVSASPFVRKVRVALAEKGIAYDLDPVLPFNVSAEFRKLSPLGKVPAYRDGDVVLADSSVICAYIERLHPKPQLFPLDPHEYARALWFEEYADSGLVAVIGPKIFLQKIVRPYFLNQPTEPEVVKKAVEEELPPMFDYLESEIRGEFIVGKQLSIGDIGLATQFVNLKEAGFGVDAARWPKLSKYVEAMHARPSFAACIEEEKQLLPQPN